MTRHIMYGIRNAVVGFVAGVAVYTGGLLLWWQLAPYDTADVKVPIEVLNENNIVQSGGELRMLIIFDKQTSVAPEVSNNITCNTGNNYDVFSSQGARSRPTGKFIAEVEFRISDLADDGEICVFTFQNSYKVNPIRTITKTWASEPFMIRE